MILRQSPLIQNDQPVVRLLDRTDLFSRVTCASVSNRSTSSSLSFSLRLLTFDAFASSRMEAT